VPADVLPTAFVDFDKVWLAYNDELLAQGSSPSRTSRCR
jgi:hypothetical protein